MSTSSVGSSSEIVIFMFPFLGRIVPDAVGLKQMIKPPQEKLTLNF